MENAIKKAMEGGWWPEGMPKSHRFDRIEMKGSEFTIYFIGRDDIDGLFAKGLIQVLLFMPAFWKAIAKAEGWAAQVCTICGHSSGTTFDHFNFCILKGTGKSFNIMEWLYHQRDLCVYTAVMGFSSKEFSLFFNRILK